MQVFGLEQSTVRRVRVRSVRIGTGVAGALALAVLPACGAVASAHHNTNPRVEHKVVGVVISTVKKASLGTILVGQKKTVYTLKPTKVSCTAVCHRVWPEVTLPKGVLHASAGAGVNASRLGIIARAGGVRQVTYEDKALYWFSGDSSVGQANGNGAKDQWGTWSVLLTVKPITRSVATTTTTSHPTTTISGGYGY